MQGEQEVATELVDKEKRPNLERGQILKKGYRKSIPGQAKS
jgi:ribosome modulation factor